MIHVCFSLHDKTGSYSKFTGTAMLSLFENTSSKVTIHLLHDNTLTDDNRDKFIQIAERYGQSLKFYNVEELCAEELAKMKAYFQNNKYFRTVALFYRFFIMNLLPQEIEKVIYFDCDIVVNLDINELWQIELEDHPLAAVTEVANGVNIVKFSRLVRDGFAKAEDYFNSGVLLMNLKVLRNEEANIQAGIKFRSEHPEWSLFDQEILNYCFAPQTLKLPVKFNHLVKQMRNDGLFSVNKEIYHYAYMKIALTSDMSDPFNHLWMSYFIKTPWFGSDIATAAVGNYLPSKKNYSVSVIIPMYNAEKYISDCLASLLIQTFQDFEVIVVDDCSTDKSFEIVESYTPKFNGRLHLVKMEKNSGGGGEPRNKGLLISCGEYIQFLDSDDMLMKTALAEMYTLAKDNDADVVYCEKYYISDDDGSNLRIKSQQKEKLVDKPTLESNDLKERIQRIIDKNYLTVPWNKLVKRDLVIKNEIFFPNVKTSEDNIWVQGLTFFAKKFLRVPNAVYIYRQSRVSSQRTERTPLQKITFWLNPVLLGLKALDKFMSRHEFFLKNPLYRYILLKEFIHVRFDIIGKYVETFSEGVVYSAIKNEFGDKLGEYDALISTLCIAQCTALYSRKPTFANDDKLREFLNYLLSDIALSHFTARIDVSLTSNDKGDIQIRSISDDKAKVEKPRGLQTNGVLYKIQSQSGKLELIIKTTVDGRLKFNLKGISVYNPKDKTKRIPHWVCYTKFAINGKKIFDTFTPTWHDKPYYHVMNVKADEEIKIEVQWLPHRDTRPDVSEVVAKIPDSNIEKLREYESLVSELRAALANEKKAAEEQRTLIAELRTALNNGKITPAEAIKNKREEMLRNTARLDIKLRGATSFPIQTISDSEAKIIQPAWMLKGGTGYIVTSRVGKLEFVAQVESDSQLNLNLRGMDVKDPKDRTKQLPYWIDYTKLVVNDEVLFDKVTPVWHDKPYYYALDVKAGEKIKIQTEWLPHKSSS